MEKKPRDKTEGEKLTIKEVKVEFIDRFEIDRACWHVHEIIKPR